MDLERSGGGIIKNITVTLKNHCYPVIISDSFLWLCSFLNIDNQKVVIITDKKVGNLYLKSLLNELNECCDNIYPFIIEPGENSKELTTVIELYQFFQENKITRDDIIICLGGGVIGDISGLAASTYLRGIRLINLPTSLLAQVDSCIGGKNAVNFNTYKNQIGTFYHPKLIYINHSLLKTLPEKEINNGIVEIMVHAIITDYGLFEYIENNMEQLKNRERKTWEYLIFNNCYIKAEIIKVDEQDNGIRKHLNFGHTFGHAIEGACDFHYSHGECVALGISSAFFVAKELNILKSTSLFERVKKIFDEFRINIKVNSLDIDKIVTYMKADKKACKEEINLILPIDIGHVSICNIKDTSLLRKALESLCESSL